MNYWRKLEKMAKNTTRTGSLLGNISVPEVIKKNNNSVENNENNALKEDKITNPKNDFDSKDMFTAIQKQDENFTENNGTKKNIVSLFDMSEEEINAYKIKNEKKPIKKTFALKMSNVEWLVKKSEQFGVAQGVLINELIEAEIEREKNK